MKIRLIRNATLRLTFAGKQVLIDPFLAQKHTIDSFVGISRNPTVDLPCTSQEVVEGADLVIVSHLHPDHFDQHAAYLLDPEIPLYCQPGDDVMIKQAGFRNNRRHYRF